VTILTLRPSSSSRSNTKPAGNQDLVVGPFSVRKSISSRVSLLLAPQSRRCECYRCHVWRQFVGCQLFCVVRVLVESSCISPQISSKYQLVLFFLQERQRPPLPLSLISLAHYYGHGSFLNCLTSAIFSGVPFCAPSRTTTVVAVF